MSGAREPAARFRMFLCIDVKEVNRGHNQRVSDGAVGDQFTELMEWDQDNFDVLAAIQGLRPDA